MSRVATNYPTTHFNNGIGQSSTTFLSRSSSNSSTTNSIGNGGGGSGGGGRNITVRSAAPPPVQKETVHACPLCNGQYKDPRVLPCTHTYCLNCIREKLIQNNCVTCPKCHHQVNPFDESDLNALQRNLILSQEWCLNARSAPSISVPKKPVTYSSIVSPLVVSPMPKQQDKRKSSVTESNGHDSTTHSHGGISALVHAFNKSSGNGGNSGGRTSRSSSVSNAPPVVSNLVKIYSEATKQELQQPQPQQPQQPQQQQQLQQQKSRSDSVMSTGKHGELIKIFEQATNRSQRSSTATSTASIIKRPSQAYEEITWDNLLHGTTPVASQNADQWQTATEHHHYPPEAPKRPISASSSEHQSNVDNLHDIISTIQRYSLEKTSPSFRQGLNPDPPINSRSSTASRSQIDSDEDDNPRTPGHQSLIYATIQPPPQQHSRQGSYADSVRSIASSSTSRQSPLPPIPTSYQVRTGATPTEQQQQQQQNDKVSYRTHSVASSQRSSNPFPPLPLNIDTLDLTGAETNKPRSISSMSSHSTAYADVNETNFLSTERFNPDTDIPIPIRTNNSSRAHSQISSRSSTPTNRPISKSIERDTTYLVPNPLSKPIERDTHYTVPNPISKPIERDIHHIVSNPISKPIERDTHYIVPNPTSSSITTAVTSRVDHLLNDQKRLEHEIEEQIKRLKFDYDDIRQQINRKESSIHNEVKNIASHLDEDITEHYHRKQKIYADLAADTNSVGTQLERLKSYPNINTNKQQLWANLEQIELNIQNIRQAVEQQKESKSSLIFDEGRREIAADTIGQITYKQLESHHRFNSPPLPPSSSQLPVSSSYKTEQTSTNITPYKYIKIDHLATLEPEAMAITENNKKILLGICNKLFILDEYGSTLKIIQLAPSIRGIAVSKKPNLQNIAYISHDETVSIIDIDNGQTIDCVKETDSTGESGTFLPLGIDTDNVRGDVYVCDYRNSCVIKFDDKLEFITQWRIYNHSDKYDEARPKLISVHGQRFYMIVEHSCKPYYNQGIAYTFSLHICDVNSGSIIKIIDADLLSTQRLRWPCSVQAINNEKCYILDTMTSGKYFNGQWQKHWSRVLEIGHDDNHIVTELFQLDSEAATMSMTKQNMIIAANGDILFVDLAFLKQDNGGSEHEYQNLP